MEHNIEWKKIPGIVGGYINKDGVAKSVVKSKETILKRQIYQRHAGGEKSYRVMFDRRRTQGKAFYKFVGTLVAENFCKQDGMYGRIFYKDGNRLNPRAENLTYTSFNHKKWDSELKQKVLQYVKRKDTDFDRNLYKYLDKGNEIYLRKAIKCVESKFTKAISARKTHDFEKVHTLLYESIHDMLNMLHRQIYYKEENDKSLGYLLFGILYHKVTYEKAIESRYCSGEVFGDDGDKSFDIWDIPELADDLGFNGNIWEDDRSKYYTG